MYNYVRLGYYKICVSVIKFPVILKDVMFGKLERKDNVSKLLLFIYKTFKFEHSLSMNLNESISQLLTFNYLIFPQLTF